MLQLVYAVMENAGDVGTLHGLCWMWFNDLVVFRRVEHITIQESQLEVQLGQPTRMWQNNIFVINIYLYNKSKIFMLPYNYCLLSPVLNR